MIYIILFNLLPAHWHRDDHGVLKRGTLIREDPCNSRFEVYYPNDTEDCDFIVLICRGPHSHPDPRPTRTPKTIEMIFMSLLETLGTGLASVTPCRIILDAAFMSALQRALAWEGTQSPTLKDLHPSLGNFDATARLINKLQLSRYPDGTGFGGKLFLLQFMSV